MSPNSNVPLASLSGIMKKSSLFYFQVLKKCVRKHVSKVRGNEAQPGDGSETTGRSS